MYINVDIDNNKFYFSIVLPCKANEIHDLQE